MYHLNIFTTLRSHNAVLVNDASAHQNERRLLMQGLCSQREDKFSGAFYAVHSAVLAHDPRSHKMRQTIWQGGKKTAKN